MISDERPGPGPEDEGVPDYADDTSTAYREQDRPRFDDSPYPVPGRRPEALDEFGLTAAEQRRGESLQGRLAREEPDVDGGAFEPDVDAGGSGPAEESAVHTVDEGDVAGSGFSEDEPAEDLGPDAFAQDTGGDEPAEDVGPDGPADGPDRAAP